MVSIMVTNARKPELTRQQFSDYWRNVHAPLVLSVPEFMRYCRSYVQYHAVDGVAHFGSDAGWDGLAVLTFDDIESMNRALSDPTYLRVVRPDESKFLDVEKCLTFVGEGAPQWLGGMLYTGAGRPAGEPLVRAFEVTPAASVS